MKPYTLEEVKKVVRGLLENAIADSITFHVFPVKMPVLTL